MQVPQMQNTGLSQFSGPILQMLMRRNQGAQSSPQAPGGSSPDGSMGGSMQPGLFGMLAKMMNRGQAQGAPLSLSPLDFGGGGMEFGIGSQS